VTSQDDADRTRFTELGSANGVGRQAFDQVSITVLDRQPPVLPALPQLAADACDPALPVTVPVPVALDACTAGAVAVTGNVVQTDGAPLPTPVPITNGQVSLAPGVHVIEWTARDASGNTVTATQILSAAACVGAGRSLRVADRARFRSASGALAPLVNYGTEPVDVGVEAQTGSIVSRGSVTLRDRSTVQGSVRIQGGLTRLNQTTITGDIRTETPVSLPPPPVIDGPWPAEE
jgi:hypothetical protein